MSNEIIKKPEEKTALLTLEDPNFKDALMKALPKHLTPDRMIKLLVTEFKANPLLLKCTLKSLFGCVMQCAFLGLEPGALLGHVFFIPFKNNKKGIYECTLIPGYKGLMKLIRQSGQIMTFDAHVIYGNDMFDFEYGSNQFLKHKFTSQNRGEMIGAYAYVKLTNKGEQFEVMWKHEIDAIKNKSQSARSSFSPWNNPDHYPEMVRKTPIRRIAKFLPLSLEAHQAVAIEEMADMGKQNLTHFAPDFLTEASEEELPEISQETEETEEIEEKKIKQENKSSQEENKKSFFIKHITDLATKKDKLKMIMETIGSQYGCTKLDEMSVEDLEKIRRILID